MSERTVWAVFKEGVYRHECGGIFTSLEKATAAAEQLAIAEKDDYHRFEVVPFTVDSVTQSEDGELEEPEAVYWAQAKGPVSPHRICHFVGQDGAACGQPWSRGVYYFSNNVTCQACITAHGQLVAAGLA